MLEMFYDRDILLIGRTENQINIYLNLLYKEKRCQSVSYAKV